MQPSAFLFGTYRLIPAARELWNASGRVALPPRAFSCLVMLVERRDRAVGRDELIAALWPRGNASDVQLGQLILQCRRAIDDDGQAQRAIRTVAGFGYRWVAATEAIDARPTSDAVLADMLAPQAAVADDVVVPVEESTDEAVAGKPGREGDGMVAAVPVDRNAWRPARRTLLLMAVLAVALLVAVVLVLKRSPPRLALPMGDRVVVLPVVTNDPEETWIRLGGMDLVGDRLRRSGIAVLPSDATLGALRGIDGGEATASPNAAMLTDLRRTAGAAIVVQGTIERRGTLWHATLVASSADGSRLQGQSGDASPTIALRTAADRLSAVLGHVPAPSAEAEAVSETLQRARAAMLANEPDVARAILMANPALVRDEPRLRQQLAEVDIRSGRFEDARNALLALVGQTGGRPSAFHAELLAALGTVFVRTGEFAEAGRYANEAIEMHVSADDAVLTGRLHLMRGVSRISLQDYSGALVDNGIARDAFARAGDVGSVARVDGNIGSLEILRGHPAQAETYLERAIAQFIELGVIQEQISNLQMLFVARRQQLLNIPAMQAIDRAWDMRERIVNPDSLLSVRLYRVQALMRVGRYADAAALLEDPANDRRPADPAEAERLRWLRAQLAWHRGKPAEALAILEPVAEDELASADSDVVRADLVLLRARLEHDQRVLPTRPIELTTDAPGSIGAHPRMPLRALASANRLWTAGQHEEAENLFQRALSLADEIGVAETTASIVVDYTRFLLESGRLPEAGAIASRVALWADQDFDCAMVQLRVAHAQGQRELWRAALERVQRLAGERAVPAELVAVPRA